MSIVSTTIKDIYRNILKGNASWFTMSEFKYKNVVFYLTLQS
jgi:hypothetical protein